MLNPPLVGWTQTELPPTLRGLIPQEGSPTSYGIPLAWENAQFFADWFYTVELTPEQATVVKQVLSEIPAPCCDDNSVYSCCCTKNGKICNLTRSARGLAHWLVAARGFEGEDLKAAVEEWLRFLKPEYYLARALEEQGLNPADYGLAAHETYESCYARQCEAPLDAGGCGGMGLVVLLSEPTAPPLLPGRGGRRLIREERREDA